ncbi:MAG: response regulator [Deltaproteobacteria bacterium]|nr:response regulator [Deltaproteobacteria bacterium]
MLPTSEPATGGRVLVVDDEPMLCRAIERMLRDLCQVVTAHDGRQALEAIAAAAGDFDLVVSDMTMPEMDGVELYERAAAAYPELARRFVFLTGAGQDPAQGERLARTGRLVLAKPASRERLRALVVQGLRR